MSGTNRNLQGGHWHLFCSRQWTTKDGQERSTMLGQTSPAAARFEALDALRGICALLVVLFHIPIYHALKGADAFVNLQFCVDMFFALSGFVLCHAYGHRLNDASEGLRFARMRLARLWPLHMVMLGLFVVIELSKLVFMRADGSLSLDSQP